MLIEMAQEKRILKLSPKHKYAFHENLFQPSV